MLWGAVLVISFVLCGLWIYAHKTAVQHWYADDQHQDTRASSNPPSINVLIAMRDEAPYIQDCLRSILADERLERLVLVDDHSTDESVLLAQQMDDPRLEIYHLGDGQQGKKAALALGRAKCNADWILQTDADCIVSDSWLSSWTDILSSHETDLACGLVRIHSVSKVRLYEFQRLDIAATMVLQHTAINHWKLPLGNAANLIYRRDMLDTLHMGGSEERSGDDIFLLEAALDDPEIKVAFFNDPRLQVFTPPEASWSALWRQRRRWAEKSGSYRSSRLRLLLLVMGISYTIALLGPLLTLITPSLAVGPVLLLLYIIGCQHYVMESIYQTSFWQSCRFTVTHIIFTLTIAASSLLPGRALWKGRRR